VLTLESGAHLKIASHKTFEPKFSEETGSFWSPAFLLDLDVVDDGTEEGEADGLTFSDRYEFKIKQDVREEEFGFSDDKPLRDAKKVDFTEAQQDLLLDRDNWTIRGDTKLDRLMICLYGKKWTEGKIDFDPDDLVNKEFIAKVKPKTGKKPGSFTEWESYVSLNRPKKKKKAATGEAKSEAGNQSDTIDLAPEDEAAMEEAFAASE
jgi:hypothetical protein